MYSNNSTTKGSKMKIGIIILGVFLVLYIFGRILQWFDEEREEQ